MRNRPLIDEANKDWQRPPHLKPPERRAIRWQPITVLLALAALLAAIGWAAL